MTTDLAPVPWYDTYFLIHTLLSYFLAVKASVVRVIPMSPCVITQLCNCFVWWVPLFHIHLLNLHTQSPRHECRISHQLSSWHSTHLCYLWTSQLYIGFAWGFSKNDTSQPQNHTSNPTSSHATPTSDFTVEFHQIQIHLIHLYTSVQPCVCRNLTRDWPGVLSQSFYTSVFLTLSDLCGDAAPATDFPAKF